MVLEPDELTIGRIREQVSNEAFLPGARRDVEDPDTRNRGTDLGYVLVAQKLVAPAD